MVLFALWVWLCAGAYGWAWDRLTGFGLLSFTAAFLIFIASAKRSPLSAGRIALLAVCALIIAFDRIHTLSFAAAALGTVLVLGGGYRALLAAGIMVLSLPTLEHLEAFFGFFVRSATAAMVAHVLGVVSSESVILLENGIADVAEACSGMKTLWTGALGLAWAWMLQARLPRPRRAVAVSVLACTALLALNALRVLVLVTLDHELHLPLLAKVMHTPLGLLGFCTVLAAAFVALRAPEPEPAPEPERAPQRPSTLYPITAVALALALRPAHAPPPPPLAISAPTLGAPLPLDPKERALFERYGARAFKYATSTDARAVKLVLVASDSYRAHHAPEVCAAAHGERIDHLAHIDLDGGIHATTFLMPSRRGLYWFERADGTTTDSLMDRVFSPGRFVLVSLVIEGADLPSAEFLSALRKNLRPMFGEAHAIARR